MKKRCMKAWILITAVGVLLSGCGHDAKSSTSETPVLEPGSMAAATNDEAFQQELFAMDTYMELRAYGQPAEAALRDAAAEIRRLEGLFSVTDETSEVYAINHGQGRPVRISADTLDLLNQAIGVSALTDRAMDVTIYPVLRAWGFTTGAYQVPEADTIASLLQTVDDGKIHVDQTAGTVQIPTGAELDLGAVAKGYSGDVCAELLRESGVSSALLNLGGSTIRTLGRKPDGSNWRIAIQDPEDPEGYAGVIELGEGAVNTSGGYERYFEENGEVYWHILDPKTGYPAKNGLISVTVLTDQACYGDGLSTALFVMGTEQAINFWQTRDDFEFVLIDDNGNVYVSEGASEAFTPMGAYESAELTVITREK